MKKELIGIFVCLLFLGVSVSSAISVDNKSTISNNKSEVCKECKEISNADLIKVERLLDRVEVYSKLLLVLSKYYPELQDINEDLSYGILKTLYMFKGIRTNIQFQDKPFICYILEPLHVTIFGMLLLLNQFLTYYANPLLQILLTPLYATIIVIYFSLDRWMDKIGCLTGPEPPPCTNLIISRSIKKIL
jgi:hypothetical protein